MIASSEVIIVCGKVRDNKVVQKIHHSIMYVASHEGWRAMCSLPLIYKF